MIEYRESEGYCFNSAVEEAVLRVGRPALTALYRERTKPANG
jgi:hypothetical protein